MVMRIDKLMVWIFTAILTLWNAEIFANRGENVNIPFQQINGLIVIEAELNEELGYFLFDTGAEEMIINEKVKSSDTKFSTISGDVMMKEKRYKEIKIGDIEYDNLIGYAADLNSIERYLNLPLAGVIGCKLFLPRVIHIDFCTNVIVASHQSNIDLSDFSEIKFQMKDGVPTCRVNIAGENYHFGFDSGATIHVVDQKIADQLGHLVKQSNKESLVTTGSQDQLIHKIVVLEQFQLKTEQGYMSAHTDSEFLIQDLSEFNDGMNRPMAGVLSLSSLNSDHIVIDLDKKRIWY